MELPPIIAFPNTPVCRIWKQGKTQKRSFADKGVPKFNLGTREPK
jgi:hypothetical protein